MKNITSLITVTRFKEGGTGTFSQCITSLLLLIHLKIKGIRCRGSGSKMLTASRPV